MPPNPLPRYRVGDSNACTVVASCQPGHLYFLRVAGSSRGAKIPLDPSNGLGLHAVFVMNQCAPNEGIDNPASGIGTSPLDFPFWRQDITRAIYCPPGTAGRIDVIGGDNASADDLFIAWRGRPLGKYEPPPTRLLTYQQAKRAVSIQLVDLDTIPADVRGAVEVESPIGVTLDVFYGAAAVAIVLGPGESLSLAGAISITPTSATIPLIFTIEW